MLMKPIATIWWREIIRFYRQRSRLFSAIAQPLVFWLLIGSGLSASFQPAGARRMDPVILNTFIPVSLF